LRVFFHALLSTSTVNTTQRTYHQKQG